MGTPYCSFSKSYYEVEYMIPGDGIRQVFICSESITRCAKRLNNTHLASTKRGGMR
jgi:ClpX C4-type zinc finger